MHHLKCTQPASEMRAPNTSRQRSSVSEEIAFRPWSVNMRLSMYSSCSEVRCAMAASPRSPTPEACAKTQVGLISTTLHVLPCVQGFSLPQSCDAQSNAQGLDTPMESAGFMQVQVAMQPKYGCRPENTMRGG